MIAIVRAATALVLCVATLGAAPPAKQPRYGPVPANAQSALVKRYVDALRLNRYDAAFALLTDEERRYYGSATSYRSVFDADGIALKSATLLGARGDDRGRVYFVRERISYVDHATDKRREIEATVPIGVLPERGTLHIKDPGKPYRAFAATATVDTDGLRVTVKKVEFYPDRIDVVVTFANLGTGFVTLLPYGKSVLRDDAGGLYRILAIKDWRITDKRLYEGMLLPPNGQYTGAIAFSATRLSPVKRLWSLNLAPALREGADAPFEITVPVTERS